MLMNHVARSGGGGFPKQWADQAIAMAMQNSWDAAVALNNQILAVAPDDVGTLNRLGRALMELGQYDDARDAYTKTLTLSPSNPIAQKNLARLAALHEEAHPQALATNVEPQMFIAEPGKAAVTAIKLKGKAVTLAKVAVGERVDLVVNRRALSVRDARGALLGAVEQRLAHRIIELMKGGNRYEAALVSSSDDAARVVIREIYQDVSQLGKVSFPAQVATAIHADLKDGLLDDADEEEPDVDDATEETEETAVSPEEDAALGRSSEDAYYA